VFGIKNQRRVAAVHDISCFGRCSLTVALPIISAAGIECCVMPTAILSTHTGGFDGYTFRDLTDDLTPTAEHWSRLGISFDAVYTGFLGSFEQLAIVSDIIDRFKTDKNLVLIDPVMADNGQLYSIFPDSFPDGMRRLCKKADVLVPNVTEAAFLTGVKYLEGPYGESYIAELLGETEKLGVKNIVLTGVHFDDSELGAAVYDAATKKISYAMGQRIEGYYHGTGDVFGSAFLSALLCGKDHLEAAQIAVDFTVGSIKRTKEAMTDVRYGVNFEAGLGELAVRCRQTVGAPRG